MVLSDTGDMNNTGHQRVTYPGDRQPLVLDALDGCGLEGTVAHIWSQHQICIGGDDPSLHCTSNDCAHSRNAKSLIDDELCMFLLLVMPVVSSLPMLATNDSTVFWQSMLSRSGRRMMQQAAVANACVVCYD